MCWQGEGGSRGPFAGEILPDNHPPLFPLHKEPPPWDPTAAGKPAMEKKEKKKKKKKKRRNAIPLAPLGDEEQNGVCVCVISGKTENTLGAFGSRSGCCRSLFCRVSLGQMNLFRLALILKGPT